MEIIKILRSLKNKKITVETKERDVIKGILKKADKKMNIYLQNVRYENEDIKDYFIKGTRIRYIILDDEDDVPLKSLKRKCVNEESKRAG